ncbi:MAG: universal stress protein [Bacteroidales bacterium]|jgi:nucleotide-binding universal stress UspA family protein|nr:universal stress protein [Bacteroidales bacterium]
MQSKILVPTNFSNNADLALNQSVYFAKKTNSEIYLLNVIPKIKDSELYIAEKDIERAQIKLEKIISYIEEKHKLVIHYRIGNGRVSTEILNSEKEIQPDMIFLGTDISENQLLSVTLRLINNVNCPIVIFHGINNVIGCKHIVLPLDLTKETQQKIELTLKIAKIYDSIVHIISLTFLEQEKITGQLTKQIEDVSSIFKENNVECFSKLILSKNSSEIRAKTINDYANENKADLIVIMTRQESKIQTFFTGSTSSKLIKTAQVPVMCIRPKEC